MALVGIAAFVLLRVSRIDIQPPSPIPSHRPVVQSKSIFWVLWFGFFFGAFAGVMVLGHAAAIVSSFGATIEQIALGTSMVAVGNGVGRLGGGWFSDRVAPRRILTAMLLLAGLALLIIVTVPGVAVSIVALTVVGIGYGTMAGAYPVIISQLYGVANFSKIYGRVFTAWGLAGLGGPALGGLLFDRSGDYVMAILLAAIAALCSGFICYTLPASRAAPGASSQ